MKLLFTGDINFRGLSEPNSKMCSDILAEILPSGNYDLISCESHLSQAKKVLEFCFLDRVAEAKEWSEKVAELTRMPV